MGKANQSKSASAHQSSKSEKRKQTQDDNAVTQKSGGSPSSQDATASHKKYKFHPNTLAKRQIRKYQKTDNKFLSNAPLKRQVKEIIAQKMRRDAEREVTIPKQLPVSLVSKVCFELILSEAESFLIDFFRQAHRFTMDEGKETLLHRHVESYERWIDYDLPSLAQE